LTEATGLAITEKSQ